MAFPLLDLIEMEGGSESGEPGQKRKDPPDGAKKDKVISAIPNFPRLADNHQEYSQPTKPLSNSTENSGIMAILKGIEGRLKGIEGRLTALEQQAPKAPAMVTSPAEKTSTDARKEHTVTKQKQLNDLQDENKRLQREDREKVDALTAYKEELENQKSFEKANKIEEEDLKQLNIPLGKGSFGRVEAYQWQGTVVAVKRLHDSKRTRTDVRLFRREVSICSSLRHPNLLTICGYVVENNDGSEIPSRLCTELMEGSLNMLIRAVFHADIKSFFYRELIDISHGIAAGMSYLHQNSTSRSIILHGDIKPGNVLVNVLMQPKIGDFGTARHEESEMSAGLHCGGVSYFFMPPEIEDAYHLLKNEGTAAKSCKNTKEADMYRVGLTLLCMIRGKLPESIIGYEVRKFSDGGLGKICADLIAKDPSDRPSAPEMLEEVQKLWVTSKYRDSQPRRFVVSEYQKEKGIELKVSSTNLFDTRGLAESIQRSLFELTGKSDSSEELDLR